MIGIIAALATFATVATGPGHSRSQAIQAEPAWRMSYVETVRCAGLTQAVSELAGGESPEGRALYDVALFWSLTAIQAAAAQGRDEALSDNDQTRARVLAVRQLTTDDPEARETLARCRTRTPNLD